MKIVLSFLGAFFLSAAAFASPSKGHSDHQYGEAAKSAFHSSEVTSMHQSGPKAKREAEFENKAVPCHNRMEHARIGGEGSKDSSRNLAERRAIL